MKELSKKLKGYDLEKFIADLLNGMGYRTRVSPHGGDNGIDITSYKDELPPKILVQVKSSDKDIQESTIMSLKGAMREGIMDFLSYFQIIRKMLGNILWQCLL